MATAIILSSALCIISYLITVFSPWPLLSLIGCAVSGFAVGVMWPGVYSVASQKIPAGGTAMFALLALAGDIGCCSGPSLVGALSDLGIATGAPILARLYTAMPLSQAALKSGFLAATAFPVVLFLGMLIFRRMNQPEKG